MLSAPQVGFVDNNPMQDYGNLPQPFSCLAISNTILNDDHYLGFGNWFTIFWVLFLLRYGRLIGHCIGYYFRYRPSPTFSGQYFDHQDVSVILPTVQPNGPDFEECVRSILKNDPAALLVVTVGDGLLAECTKVLKKLVPNDCATKVSVSALNIASKRRQVAHAVPEIRTTFTVLADDHVFWPSTDFLQSIIAPFEDSNVGVVAPVKRVRRTTPGEWSWDSVINFIACNYLQRHNWELRASNAIDGGVFVVSGRTAAYRTRFLQSPGLLRRLCNEKFFFGLFGGDQGLGPDDDNFLTREIIAKGYKIRFQDTVEATVETTLGEWPKFRGQLLRWARTTFRSNPVMLRNLDFLCRYPWSYFMVYIAGMINFAILWDAALMVTLWNSTSTEHKSFAMFMLVAWIVFTKTIKIIPHFWRHPSDLLLLPAQIAFAYTHSFIKFWALVTFWDCDWSGRKLDDIQVDGKQFDWTSI